MLMLDSSVWFDYFLAKPWTKYLKARIDSNEPLLLSTVNLIEIYSIYLKRDPIQAEEKRKFLLSRCTLVDVDSEVAIQASQLKSKHALAIADAIVLATARMKDVLLTTLDSDFRGLPEVRVLARR